MSLDINLTGVEKTSNKKTTLTDNSDTFYPTQKAVKTAVDAKENTITAGTTAQYFRGDKTFQTLDKTAVGLSNVDNTSDANKPVSTATQTAVDAKFNTPTGTTAQYIRGDGSLETFPTIPDPADFVEKSDFTSHSILAKQSGASDPVAVSIGNNEILGRESGGGADIKGLSASEVKAMLAFTKAEIMAGLEMEEIFITGDQTTPSTTAVSIIDLVTTTLTTGKYKINGTIGVGSNTTTGMKLGIIIPTGATMKLKGLDRGSTFDNSITEIFTTSNTLSTGNFCRVNGESIVNINGTITIGATSGVVQFIFAKTTSGTATITDEGTQITIEKL
jgi:hypothetical protein